VGAAVPSGARAEREMPSGRRHPPETEKRDAVRDAGIHLECLFCLCVHCELCERCLNGFVGIVKSIYLREVSDGEEH